MFGSVASTFLVGYLLLLGLQAYNLYFPQKCNVAKKPSTCIHPTLLNDQLVDMYLFASPSPSAPSVRNIVHDGDGPQSPKLLFRVLGNSLDERLEQEVQLPFRHFGTRDNGTLYAHLYIFKSQLSEQGDGGIASTLDAASLALPGASAGEPLTVLTSPLTRFLPAVNRSRVRPLISAAQSTPKAAVPPPQQDALPAPPPADALGDNQTPESSSLAPDACVAGDTADSCVAALDARSDECAAGELDDTKCQREEETSADDSVTSAEQASVSAEQNKTEETKAVEVARDPPEVFLRGERYTHLRPEITFRIAQNRPTLSASGFPPDMKKLLKRVEREPGSIQRHVMKYEPPVEVDNLLLLKRQYRLISRNPKREDPILKVVLLPTSLGTFRLLNNIQQSLNMMHDGIGLSEEDTEDMKEMFIEFGGSWKIMAMTFTISILHSFFAVLAFKNDVGFWKRASSFEGLSMRSFFTSFICQVIIFLKLADAEHVSTIILAEVGIGCLIEGWKVSKIITRRGLWSLDYWLPWRSCTKEAKALRLSKMGKGESATEEHDAVAMKWLGRMLYPIVAAWGGYSLVYYHHKSWWSWFIGTLSNGVYIFGFIAMTPQLYINYRLKSVAHLPWRALMYKAFNTFIDDVFAFGIIEMPMTHRLACLRDDVIFFGYLYQRWCYPVDKSRPNEFGRAYADEDEDPVTSPGDQAAPPALLEAVAQDEPEEGNAPASALAQKDFEGETPSSAKCSPQEPNFADTTPHQEQQAEQEKCVDDDDDEWQQVQVPDSAETQVK